MDTLINFDGQILVFIQEHIRNGILTPFFKFITSTGDKGLIWILLALILLIPKKTRKVGIMCLVALVGSLLINNVIIKNLVQRTRPYEVVDGLKCLIGIQKDFSFPSGHTGSSFAAAVVMYKELPKKFGIPAVIYAGLIAFSRLYVGVHYPSDVLFAIITGCFIALGSIYIVDRLFSKYFQNGLESK